MKITRQWAMPNKSTFIIEPIKDLIKRYMDLDPNRKPKFGNLTTREQLMAVERWKKERWIWVDPFAGWNSPAHVTNDLNPERETDFTGCALEFLRGLSENSIDGVFYDPPFSLRQAVECYQGYGGEHWELTPDKANYWAECKNEIARITKVNGIVICCGWDSQGIGKNRDFRMIEILLVPHGGKHYDTIVTVERKKSHQYQLFNIGEIK